MGRWVGRRLGGLVVGAGGKLLPNKADLQNAMLPAPPKSFVRWCSRKVGEVAHSDSERVEAHSVGSHFQRKRIRLNGEETRIECPVVGCAEHEAVPRVIGALRVLRTYVDRVQDLPEREAADRALAAVELEDFELEPLLPGTSRGYHFAAECRIHEFKGTFFPHLVRRLLRPGFTKADKENTFAFFPIIPPFDPCQPHLPRIGLSLRRQNREQR